jgi:DNA-directed RNA polymerase subunit RPC12/RpoP
MSYEICESCGKEGDTDSDDGGITERWFARTVYTCAACVKAQIAAEDAPGDEYEERKIREGQK